MKWQDFDYGKWCEKNKEFDHETWDRLTGKMLSEISGQKDAFELLFAHDKKIVEACGGRPPPRPRAHYNECGDILEIWLSHPPNGHYAKWLCPSVTVLLCFETHEVVGVQVWGLSRLLLDLEDLKKFIGMITKQGR